MSEDFNLGVIRLNVSTKSYDSRFDSASESVYLPLIL